MWLHPPPIVQGASTIGSEHERTMVHVIPDEGEKKIAAIMPIQDT